MQVSWLLRVQLFVSGDEGRRCLRVLKFVCDAYGRVNGILGTLSAKHVSARASSPRDANSADFFKNSMSIYDEPAIQHKVYVSGADVEAMSYSSLPTIQLQ